jgi:hypothetical protein
MKKIRVVIKGDTVYELNKFTGKPIRIVRGVKKYFERRNEERGESDDEIEFIPEPERRPSPGERRKQLLALAGNKKKLVSKADGLNREIPVDETEHEPEPEKERFTKYRKKRVKKSKLRKPTKKCKCKK